MKKKKKLRPGKDLGSDILIDEHTQGPNPNKKHQRLEAMEALVASEERLARSIQAAAAEYVPEAIQTLGKFSGGKKVNDIEPSAPVVRQSARDIIEFAGGRPETRVPERPEQEKNQLNVFVMRFGEDTAIPLEMALNQEMATNPLSQVEQQRLIAEGKITVNQPEPERRRKSIQRTYEVPDESKDDGGEAA